MSVAVRAGVGHGVGVGLGVGRTVGCGVGVALGVGLGVGHGVGLGVGRTVGRGVDVGSGVGIGVGATVGCGVGVEMGIGVAVVVGVGVSPDVEVVGSVGGDGCAVAPGSSGDSVVSHAWNTQIPAKSTKTTRILEVLGPALVRGKTLFLPNILRDICTIIPQREEAP